MEPQIPKIVTSIYEAISLAIGQIFWFGFGTAIVAFVAVLAIRELPLRSSLGPSPVAAPAGAPGSTAGSPAAAEAPAAAAATPGVTGAPSAGVAGQAPAALPAATATAGTSRPPAGREAAPARPDA